MTPDEARQISRQNGRIIHLIDELYRKIQVAAEDGEYCCYLHALDWRYTVDHSEALTVIEDQGFHVDRNYDNPGFENIVCISWRV